VAAVNKFLASLGHKPDVADLGAGDFSVGQRIRPQCRSYIACDIVAQVVAYNRERFKDLDVDFRVLDISKDDLPGAEVVFIRQVLQHLSNKMITQVVAKLPSKYSYLVLTEHVPAVLSFRQNLDKPVGSGIRLEIESGVVLTSPPFNLKVKDTLRLCEVLHSGGLIRTVVYRLR